MKEYSFSLFDKNYTEFAKYIISNPYKYKEVFMNSESYDELQSFCGTNLSGPATSLFGLKIIPSPFVPKHPTKWIFPKTPFIEYSEADEAWARPLGFGSFQQDKSSYVFYFIDTSKLRSIYNMPLTNKFSSTYVQRGVIRYE